MKLKQTRAVNQQDSESGCSNLLSVAEAANYLRLKTSTLRAWILRRQVSYIKLGGRVFFRLPDLEALLATSLVPAKSALNTDPKNLGGVI